MDNMVLKVRNKRGIVDIKSAVPLFDAQPHAEEVCRKSGAWGARRVGGRWFFPTRCC